MNRLEHLLAVLAEECAEVGQRAMKAQRFGIYQCQPGQNQTNAERTHVELNDLYAAVDMIRDELGLVSHFGWRDETLIRGKMARVEKYMAAAMANDEAEIAKLDRERGRI